ncbi:MAG: hypothetical protein HQ495_07385 [Alphaproteobacteria bacterium]|nr:hypothetical protein [Alphaproteobacteria bacterium]
MIVSLAIIWGLVVVLALLTYLRRPGLMSQALRSARAQGFVVIPRMPIALIGAGFLAELLPQAQMSGWIGAESGFTGVLIAVGLGALVPSGPIISFPIAIALMHLGAGVPQLVAFLTAWSLYALNRMLIWEAPLMGWSFVSRRIVVSIPGPFVTTLIATVIGSYVQIVAG